MSSIQNRLRMIHQYQTVVLVADDMPAESASVIFQSIPMMLRHVERLRIVVAGVREERLLDQFCQYAPVVRVPSGVDGENMPALFAAADLTVITSAWRDDLAVAVRENLQVGTPVVAPTTGHFPELIREGETGYLFPAGDAAALAAKVVLHFALPAYERQRMRHLCREKAQVYGEKF